MQLQIKSNQIFISLHIKPYRLILQENFTIKLQINDIKNMLYIVYIGGNITIEERSSAWRYGYDLQVELNNLTSVQA